MTQPTGGDRRPSRPRPATARRPPQAPAAHPQTLSEPPPGRDRRELTDDDREWARRIVATLPPLTDRQRDILALLLRRCR